MSDEINGGDAAVEATPPATVEATKGLDPSYFKLDASYERWNDNVHVERHKEFMAAMINQGFVKDPEVANDLLNMGVDLAQELIADYFELTEQKAKENREMQDEAYRKLVPSEAERFNLEYKTDILFFSDSPNAPHYKANLAKDPSFKMLMAENKHLLQNIGTVNIENLMTSENYSRDDKVKIYHEEHAQFLKNPSPERGERLLRFRRELYGS